MSSWSFPIYLNSYLWYLSSDMLFKCNFVNAINIQEYFDSNFVGDKDKRRSLSEYIFTVFGNVISWKSNLESIVALSTIEVELIACTKRVKECLWLKGFTKQFGIIFDDVIDIIFCENNSTIHSSKHPMFHFQSNHVNIKIHFITNIVSQSLHSYR